MVKILQYGEGNFLRTFADVYFDTLNKNGRGEYEVNIVKPIPFGNLKPFEEQKNRYRIVLRGMENGKPVENIYRVDSVRRAIDPFVDYEAYISLAREKDLKIIVSNTTEAGICYRAEDRLEDFERITYPAKLTKFLFERFQTGLEGVYLLPVELIDNNADELKKCVDRYIELWRLPQAFKKWNDENNFYCNTLVDRIVSGYPRDEETRTRLETLIGERDALLSVGEPFGLWAIEKKGDISNYIREGMYNVEVVLTNDIGYYKKRKVRVLNGSHTNLVGAGLVLGATTVYDCMADEKLSSFAENVLREEIIPYVSKDVAATAAFADSVKERFKNPFLNHRLTSIALNCISKWKARVLPSFKDYYFDRGKLAPYLTIGFSYLMALYVSVQKQGDRYVSKLEDRMIELNDDVSYLEYFADGKSIVGFMSDKNVWGEDLTNYEGFAETVLSNVEKIKKGICLL